MNSDEQVREAQRQVWARCSEGWDKWDAVIHEQLGPVGEAIVDALEPQPDQCHLDIASGTGEPGLTLAHRAPEGRVVLTDLASEMLEVAARRAAEQGLTNVETTVCSADDLPFEDATFDSVSVRFGYMFFPDLARATSEFVRVLRPGGRLCASVWARPDGNPWTSIVMDAIATEVPLAPPAPGAPHMYRCAAAGQISTLLEQAGLGEVREWEVGVELVTASAQEYWDVVSEHVSSAVMALQAVEAPARQRIAERAIARVAAYAKDGHVRVPGVARCIAGQKPA
jgi:ubiquinone/menaquinone biosynthesis C-methylase UbiE